MVNVAQQSRPVLIKQKPLRPVFTPHLEEQVTASKNRERPNQEELVMEILESTRRIRFRTDNQEILAILDEIVWLARSI